jgi:hypothetical protein
MPASPCISNTVSSSRGCHSGKPFQAVQSQSPTPLAVMTILLVCNTLLAAGLGRLRDACCRPRWHVPVADLKELLFSTPNLEVASAGSGLGLSPGQSGQTCITGHFQQRSRRARLNALLPPTVYLWQLDPPLQANVTMDLTNHYQKTLPASLRWEILQRNGQIFMNLPGQAIVSFNQGQFGMLRTLHSEEQPDQRNLLVSFLTHLRVSCLVQQGAD